MTLTFLILVSHKNPWAGPTENENEREDQLMKRNETKKREKEKKHNLYLLLSCSTGPWQYISQSLRPVDKKELLYDMIESSRKQALIGISIISSILSWDSTIIFSGVSLDRISGLTCNAAPIWRRKCCVYERPCKRNISLGRTRLELIITLIVRTDPTVTKKRENSVGSRVWWPSSRA